MTDLKPCLLQRKILPKVWGGRALEQVFGISLPAGEDVGETWELYDRPDGSSVLRGSEETVRDLMRRDPQGLLGRARPARDGWFPLLIKFIDARKALSVQVHPDDEQARSEGDGGKNEAWLVLEAGAEARIVRGFADGVTREQFAAVASTEAVESLLHSFRPEVGDCVHLPAGTVHALGPDVVVLEVQQNSDVTYRIWDWGRPRETHVEKALAVARVEGGEQATVAPEPIDQHSEWLVRDEHFRVRRFRLPAVGTLGTEGSFKVMTVLKGRSTLGWHSGGEDPPLIVGPGDTVLIPACTGTVFLSPIGGLEAIWCDAGEGA